MSQFKGHATEHAHKMDKMEAAKARERERQTLKRAQLTDSARWRERETLQCVRQ